MSQAKSISLIENYDATVASGALKADAGQRAAAMELNNLYQQLVGQAPAPHPRWQFWKPTPKATLGLYLWGDVGRGKSMLMDLFIRLISKTTKTRRVHFHAFMLDVHRRLFAFRKHHSGDVMDQVIQEVASEARILCLDEFQVTDVTDAMLLARLFAGLIDAGVVVVFTSNRKPRDLYLGGLQRDQFLKLVDLLEARIRIISLESDTDYRLQQLRAMRQTFMHPRDGDADDFLMESWAALTGNAASEPLWLEVQGRTLRVDKHYKGTAWLTFGELCVRPLGANDYLTLAKVCHTILLQGIPKLSPEYRNEAKRFVTLIDTLYDQRVKLIATAATAPDDIYPTGDGSFEFHRTASRLHEMQSETYLALAHLA